MSKKSRRRRATRPRLSPSQMVRPEEQRIPQISQAPAAVLPNRPQSPAHTSLRDLREEYPYVAADLKRIAIIAAIMLVILIGLALLLV